MTQDLEAVPLLHDTVTSVTEIAQKQTISRRKIISVMFIVVSVTVFSTHLHTPCIFRECCE